MEYVGLSIYGKRFRIIGFCCIHFGEGCGHDSSLFSEFLSDVEHTPNALVLGLGDYIDWTRTTHRGPLRAIGGDDEKFIEELDAMVSRSIIEPLVWKIRKQCPSFAKKCIGLVEGNHYHKFFNGMTSTQKICELLGVRYLGQSAWVRIACARSLEKKRKCYGATHNLNIALNHSVSSSGALPASLNQAQGRIAGLRDVDIFLTGNDHQLGHMVIQQLGCTQRGEPKMMQKEMVVGKCGSFQKGYEEGATSNSYVEKKFLRPSHLGYLAFDAHIHYHTDKPEVWRFDNFNV